MKTLFTGLAQMNRSMKHTRQVAYLMMAMAVVVTTAGCSRGEVAAANDSETPEQANVRVTNVEATQVQLGEFRGVIRVTGEVEALYDVTVSAEESGRVESFLVEKGRRVRRGQAIARLESDLLSAQVDEARASARLAREEYERQRQLWEEDSIGTEMAFLQRRYASEMAAARLASLEARLLRTEIIAPVTGTFEEKYLEVGEMAVPGAAVVRVVATDRVKIVAGVPERHARTVVVGDQALVSLDVFPDQEFVGEVSFAGASVDPRSRTFRIEVILDNPGGMMKPAMVANLEVEREFLENVISVPQQVVLRSAEGYKVFVADSAGDGYVAHARTVELGVVSGDDVVIEGGLEIGELLITVGHQLVDDGSPIRIVNSEQSGQAEEEN
jgi:RND family efflux transporter MFP subunit